MNASDREWLNSTTVSPTENKVGQQLFINILYTIIGVIGISGNGLVLFVIIKVPDLRSITNLLIGNQSLVDLFSSFLLLVTFLPPPIDVTHLSQTNPMFASFLCKVLISRFIYWGTIKVSTMNLVCLTLERYLAVVHPHKYRQRASMFRAVIVCFIVWLVGPLTEMYFLFTFTVQNGECKIRDDISSGVSYFLAFEVFVFTLVLPLATMAYVYVSIIRTLRPVKPLPKTLIPNTATNKSNVQPEENRPSGTPLATISGSKKSNNPKSPGQATILNNSKANLHIVDNSSKETSIATSSGESKNNNLSVNRSQEKAGNNSPNSSNSSSLRPPGAGRPITPVTPRSQPPKKDTRNMREQVRRNVLATMFLVCLVYAICWIPNQFIYFVYQLGVYIDTNGFLYKVTVFLAAMNVCVNPIIYAFKYRKFQMGLRVVFLGQRSVVWETTQTEQSN